MKVKGLADTIDWYDNNADKYAEELHKVAPIESIDSFINYLPKGAYILEAGCGPGRETKIFTEKRIKTCGIDLSEGLLEIARKINPDTEYIKGSFLQLPFPNETFDGVWAHASLVHLETIEDVESALNEFCRVLKNKGILFVGTKMQIGEEKTAIVSDTLSNHERFFRYYKSEEISNYIKEAGFEIMESIVREDGHGRKEVQWIKIIARKL
jgi:ubiquinone/menaquinone biosynthesis C-methylase UbiE